MLTTDLFTRSLGHNPHAILALDQTTRQVTAIQPAPHVRFQGRANAHSRSSRDDEGLAIAHAAGVNAIAVDRFEGRYLLSGAADGEVAVWDLEAAALDDDPSSSQRPQLQSGRRAITHTPLAKAPKSPQTHTHGITTLTYYPFDSLAFTTSSYDHRLHLWDSTTLQPSATFTPTSTPIYAHALSPIAPHLLVACATQTPTVRLVDLRSGSATHSLAGHAGGAVLSVAWSPKAENVLASGGVDRTVRLWDVRRSAGCLGVLDAEDGVGVGGYDGVGTGARGRQLGVAHAGPVNGLCWDENGRWLVSVGHDERMRVWDVSVGANTFVTFPPVVRNRSVAGVAPLIVPRGCVRAGEEVLMLPSEREVLMFEMFEGRLIKRLKAPGIMISGRAGGDRNIKERVTALAWRNHDVEMFSAHGDGSIRSWQPRTFEDAFVEEADAIQKADTNTETRERKRKRQILEDLEDELTKPKVTFS